MNPNARSLIRPSAARPGSPAIAIMSDDAISGTMIMRMDLIKSVPNGSRTEASSPK